MHGSFSFPLGLSNPDPLQTVHLIRERLRSDGFLPQGLLRQEIDASWRRSLDHGVDLYDKRLISLQDIKNLEELRAANRMLLDAAIPEVEFVAERYGKQGFVILADADANILAVEGRVAYLKNLGISDITPGACWSESLRGTNALGTALIEGRPVAINTGEHFLDCLSSVSCKSLPITDPFGNIIGVLDLTREGQLPVHQDNLSMLISTAASHIELRLFDAFFPQHVMLAFHPHRQYLNSPWRGVLAVSDEGEILAANSQACELLDLTRAGIVGRRCEGGLGTRGAPFMTLLEQTQTLGISAVCREFCFEVLRLPRSPIISRSGPPKQTKAHDQADGLAALAGGQSRLFRMLQMARQGLNNGLPVLLQGETGTGKEVIARGLHNASTRAGKPFTAVNCASIPEGLIESELFGYREGAFTGARKGGMVGRLMQANGGTLFLDEIGDMPNHLQARLLRVLQERKVAPLGAAEEQNIDIAVICATHRDLKVMVREKAFREDLYYRINGVGVHLPALREREDIDLLVATLLEKLGAPHVTISVELAEIFRNHDWPGNIRQLEMVLRTALAVRGEEETELGVDHLCDGFIDGSCATSGASFGLIRKHETELIRESLEKHDGNVAAAAQTLGISRATLYRKLKRLRV